jgi:hypothetical protein
VRMKDDQPYFGYHAKSQKKPCHIVGKLGVVLIIKRPYTNRLSLDKENLVGVLLWHDRLVVIGQWRHTAPPRGLQWFKEPLPLLAITRASILEALDEG